MILKLDVLCGLLRIFLIKFFVNGIGCVSLVVNVCFFMLVFCVIKNDK